jgi:hypothetical protein
MQQLPLFPSPPKPAVKPVHRKASTKFTFARIKAATRKCDDCLTVLYNARGIAPVSRLARWRCKQGGAVLMLCHGHKRARVDEQESMRETP